MSNLFDLKIKSVSLTSNLEESRKGSIEAYGESTSGVNHCGYTPSYGNSLTLTNHTKTGCTIKTMVCMNRVIEKEI
ncbi:hypothetical protein [Granulicatella sp.]